MTELENLASRTESLLAKDSIRDVLYRYCRGIDRCDRELLMSVYWPDGVDNHGMFNGRASDYCDYVIPLLQTMARTMHHLTNILIELDGLEMARVETYFLALHELKNGGELSELVVAGRYLDRFDRRGGEWKIKERFVLLDWNQQQRSTADWKLDSFLGQLIRGARKPDDMSYLGGSFGAY
jgi:hypothetical protein